MHRIIRLLLLSLIGSLSGTSQLTASTDGYVVVKDKTNIDFSEAMIEGKFQAPTGFFLQGRQAQALTPMVKLRPDFRQELRNSRDAVKSLVK